MSKKKPKVKTDRTRLRALTVDGYATWLENLFPYNQIAINFPELDDAVAQLCSVLRPLTIDELSDHVTITAAQRKTAARLLHEHRTLMEIRYANYYKPAVAGFWSRPPGGQDCSAGFELVILTPSVRSESYRKDTRAGQWPLGEYTANVLPKTIVDVSAGSFREQMTIGCEFCASRNIVLAARKAGSFEQLINQTVEKYLGYKFGVPHADS